MRQNPNTPINRLKPYHELELDTIDQYLHYPEWIQTSLEKIIANRRGKRFDVTTYEEEGYVDFYNLLYIKDLGRGGNPQLEFNF